MNHAFQIDAMAVTAPSEKLLDLIQERLEERGFLAELKDYEPINFWEKETKGKG